MDYKEIKPTRKHWTKWSKEEEELVLNKSMKLYEIAKKLGRTYYAVASKRKRLEFKKYFSDFS